MLRIQVIYIKKDINSQNYTQCRIDETFWGNHYGYVMMGAIASQITSLAIIYSAFHLGADQRKHQSSASLAFVRGIHRGPVNSPHKWPVTRKMFRFDDVMMVLVFLKVFLFWPICRNATLFIYSIVHFILHYRNMSNKIHHIVYPVPTLFKYHTITIPCYIS